MTNYLIGGGKKLKEDEKNLMILNAKKHMNRH